MQSKTIHILFIYISLINLAHGKKNENFLEIFLIFFILGTTRPNFKEYIDFTAKSAPKGISDNINPEKSSTHIQMDVSFYLEPGITHPVLIGLRMSGKIFHF